VLDDKSIGELNSMNDSDKRDRCRERIIQRLELEGKIKEALTWLWKDIEARQKGD
jgi:hypothetical protein